MLKKILNFLMFWRKDEKKKEAPRREPVPVPVPVHPHVPPLILGINSHGIEEYFLSHVSILGLKHIRFTIYTHLWRDSNAYRIWTAKQLKEACRKFKVLVVVHGEVEGSKEYVNFLDSLSWEFTAVESWQIGNEAPVVPVSGEEWREIHSKAYSVIKYNSPKSCVVTMAFSPEQLHEPFGKAFIEANPLADAIAIHIYGPPLGRRLQEIKPLISHIYKPIWITEFGVDSLTNGETEQMTSWKDFITEADGIFERAYGYNLQSDESGEHGVVEGHGILRPDGTPKPVYNYLSLRNESS